MKTAIYAICYNEEYMLPFFLRHYQAFADKITIYDNHSTDQSVHIMNSYGVDVRYFETDNSIRDDIMIQLKNQFWKESRGHHDWVIVADIDEFVHAPNIKRFFARNSDKSLIVPHGYNMFCDRLPNIHHGQMLDQVRLGTQDFEFCTKPCVFKPNKIEEINFVVGGHVADPTGEVVWGRNTELKLLHCDYLTLDFRMRKCSNRGKRLSELNRTRRWGVQYMRTPEEIEADYNARRARSEIVV